MAPAANAGHPLPGDTLRTASAIKTRAIPVLMPAVTGVGIILKTLPSFSKPVSITRPLASKNIKLPAANPKVTCCKLSPSPESGGAFEASASCMTNPM